MKTIRFTADDMDAVVCALQAGSMVAFPTDTVYGLGVVYDDEQALQRLKIAKGRPDNKPIPTMVSSLEQLAQVAVMDQRAKALMKHFMPGAITLIMKKKAGVGDYVSNGLDTIGVRMPDDPFILELIQKCGKPLLVSSANLSGAPTGLYDRDVLQQLDGRIDAIVMGEARGKAASTIVDISGEACVVVREGPICARAIQEVIGNLQKGEKYENSDSM